MTRLTKSPQEARVYQTRWLTQSPQFLDPLVSVSNLNVDSLIPRPHPKIGTRLHVRCVLFLACKVSNVWCGFPDCLRQLRVHSCNSWLACDRVKVEVSGRV